MKSKSARDSSIIRRDNAATCIFKKKLALFHGIHTCQL